MRFLCNLLILLCFPALCFGASSTKFLSADYIEYNKKEDFAYAKGNIKVIKDQYILTADSILYDIKNDLLWAKGNIIIRDSTNKVILGETAFFKDKLKIGVISDFILKFNDNTILAARLAKRISENQAVLYKSTFSPCAILCYDKPFWQISAKDAHIDLDNEVMTYKNMFFEVYGVPIFYTPYFSHPTPSAKAKSGLLVPQIRNGELLIPLYLRMQNNLDVTITPRIAPKYTIFELEMRHKLQNGEYKIFSSYGEVPYKVGNKLSTRGFHLFTNGDFHKNNYRYGFDLKHVSDKAYLKNYYNLHDNYLTSKLYINKIKETDYLAVEGLYFQGLRDQDTKGTDPLILPKIRSKNIINLNDNESTYFTIENNILSFNQRSLKRVDRGSVKLSLSNNILTHSGHLLNISAHARGDIYNIKDKLTDSSRVLTRTIPEAELSWRYPLINRFNYSNVIIEPMISGTIGPNFKPRFYKFGLIDSKNLDISEDNLFISNRFSGIDYHEFGRRINYGINTTMLLDENYLSLFLGRSNNKNNVPINAINGNIGKIQIDIFGNTQLFYRFKAVKKFKPIKQEIGGTFHNDKLSIKASYIKLNNISKYYKSDNFLVNNDKIEQLHNEISYNITQQWIIENSIQLDFADKQKVRVLSHGVNLTYLNDCFSISGRIYKDYTSNTKIGITKARSISISIGLKALNM